MLVSFGTRITRLLLTVGLLLIVVQCFQSKSFNTLSIRRGYLSMVTTLPAATTSSSAVKYTDSTGAAMELRNVHINIGSNQIIQNANWVMNPNERWGIVGRNGEGKSTLLKALTNTGGETLSISEGEILISKKARLGYLEQKGVSGSTKTVREEVTSRMDRLSAATKKLEQAEKLVSDGDTSDAALLMLEEASAEFERAGGYTIEQKIANVLKGLGFLPEDYDRLCSEFSGGWQMRIALARLLLSEPSLLLLDEPTNHLDKGARDWLGDYLSRYDGTLIVVSHDESLLKKAVSSIAEVQQGRISLYKSRSHDQWLVEREERVKAAAALYESNQREIARLQEFVDRFGAKTMGASLAQSKLKAIEKLREEAPEPPKTTADVGPLPRLILPKPPRGTPKVLLQVKNGSVSWQGSKPILKDINLTIEKGWRIAVRGPNGAGKSTLFNALSGELPLTAGDRIEGDMLELGFFKQDLAQELPPTCTAVEVVTNIVRVKDASISDEKARTVLGTLGLIKEKGTRLIQHLSGGEKARVALAAFVLIPRNLLLLDEPSNHLDQVTIDALTSAIKSYEGSTIVISHDRAFLEEYSPTHVLTVRNGHVTMEERGLQDEDWKDVLNSREASKFASNNQPSATVTSTKAAVTATSKDNDDKLSKKSGNKSDRRVGKVETMIAKYEAELEVVDGDMTLNGRNTSKLYELQKKKDEIQNKLDVLFEELSSL